METWNLDDIPWDQFDPSKVNPELLLVVKAASLVEYNADDYRTYLQNVFSDNDRLKKAIDQWSVEEVQHGRALARWATLADPAFDFDLSFGRFVENYRVPTEVNESVRGSRTGELIARCMVETGTNSFYSALADATEEPVLKAICRQIAADEFAHYCLFHAHMRKHLRLENLTFRERLSVAFRRIAETEDDELATAYWAANRGGEHFDRPSNAVAYARASLRYYRPEHIVRGVEMIFGALGLDPAGPTGWIATRAVRVFIWHRVRFTPWLAVVKERISSRYPQLDMFAQRG